jgi:hypothetical protein
LLIKFHLLHFFLQILLYGLHRLTLASHFSHGHLWSRSKASLTSWGF